MIKGDLRIELLEMVIRTYELRCELTSIVEDKKILEQELKVFGKQLIEAFQNMNDKMMGRTSKDSGE